jgi:hypothetical protein
MRVILVTGLARDRSQILLVHNEEFQTETLAVEISTTCLTLEAIEADDVDLNKVTAKYETSLTGSVRARCLQLQLKL